MRNGQNKRMRNRNRKGHNPATRVYESNGPDVKIRGTAPHIAEKYVQLARDAQSGGDYIAAENYNQHAEHYFRIIAASQEQFRQHQPFSRNDDMRDDGDDSDVDGGYAGESVAAPREAQQPFPANEPQPFSGRNSAPAEADSDIERLPSFITGGQPQAGGDDEQPQGHGHANGSDARYPRRRRRHPGPRPKSQASEDAAAPGAE